MITGIYKTLRDSSKTSTGLNYIMLQLSSMDEDGNAISGLTAEFQSLFDTYTDGAVQMMNENGELRSSYDILEDLAGVWDKLSINQQNYIAQTIAGTRNSKALLSMMNNWGTVEDSLSSALNSAGSASQENEKYLNSIEG